MQNVWKPLLVSGLLVVLLVALLVWKPGRGGGPGGESLLVYCAAGIKNPVAEVARQYEKEFGVAVGIQYGGSGTLLSNLRVAKRGDLYVAADTSYIDLAREQQLLDEAIPLARQRPVIAVKKGNAAKLKIASIEDLLREDVKVALADPRAASVGKVTRALLEKQGRWEAVDAAVRKRGVYKPTVNEVANDVKLGTVQAGIIWDATVNQYPGLESVSIEGADAFVMDVTVGVLRSTRQPTAALRFARYLAARDKGLRVFQRMGFPAVEGDAWAVEPDIVYFSGGVNRIGIQETLKKFEEREGVRIKTVYNGCGILAGSIKQGASPDGYHTCDLSFMEGVEDKFTVPDTITETQMVIITPLDRTEINDLKDLAKPGLKLGLANEKQSALGALTARLLRQQGLYDAVTANAKSRTPTADLLVNQTRTGSLDAAIVYEANTSQVKDKLRVVRIELPEAKAIQTFAVGKDSKYKHLMGRLHEAVLSAGSRERFRQAGFRWLAGDESREPSEP